MSRNHLNLALTLVALLATPSLAASVSFTASATDLNTPANWTLYEVLARNPGGDATISASGISSPMTDRIQVNWTVDNTTTGRRGEVGLVLNSASWDPSTDGAIQAVDFSAEQQYVTISPKSRFMIVQDGNFYISNPEFFETSQSATDLHEADFDEIDTSTTGSTGLLTLPASHPDFSASGGVMQFGLWSFQASSGQAPGSSTEAALDYGQFSVTVQLAGPCLDLFADVDHPEPVEPPRPDPAPGLPNIVIVIADDMGYGDLGITGHPFIRTPNIDRIGNEGAVFPHYYAPMSICSPSRAAMLTGRTPYRLGIYSFIPDDNDFGYLHLDSSEVTFPQLLQDVGYQTALVGKWHISHPDWYAEEDQPRLDQYGFDYWFSSKNNTVILNKPAWYRNNVSLGTINGYAANVVGDEAVDWLDNHRDPARPFLLFVNFYEPHWKVDGPPALVTSYETNYVTDLQRAHYPACIENVDGEVGRVLDRLDAHSLTTNTIVMFTSDHGPAKFASGSAYNRNDGRATPYRGRKYGLWDGSVHVPGLLRWPKEITAGTVVTEPVGSIDWLQTFCSITGAQVPTDRPLDGADFSPLLLGGAFTRTTHLQWHHYNSRLHDNTCPQSALRDGDYVLVGVSESPGASSSGRWALGHMDKIWNDDLVSFELFNILNDPMQFTNVWASQVPLAESLRDALTNYNFIARSDAPGWGYGLAWSSYQAWRTNTWSGPAATDDLISGPEADPDGDHWWNFAEYALAMDPMNPDDKKEPSYATETYGVDGDTNRYTTCTFAASADAAACYMVGHSNNLLAPWNDVPDTSVLTRRRKNSDGTSTMTFRRGEPHEDADKQYFRLSVAPE